MLACLVGDGSVAPLWAADITNEPTSGPGIVPAGEDGKPLNLNFETGDLKDWTATGKAFEQQPIKGGIAPDRPLGAGKKSLHTGEYWMGGFEKLYDDPQGTLTSVAFKVTQPWASMLVGGGSLLRDFDQVLRQETKLPILRSEDPFTAVVHGAGKALEDLQLLRQVALN